jgi:L-asparagine transporter-like permease
MNRFEEESNRQRKAQLKSSVALWTGGLILVAVAFAIVGLSSGAPTRFWSKAAIVLAVLLLILRQVNRRLRGRRSKAAQPDPASRLNLQ